MGDAFGVAGSAVGVISLGIQVCQGLLKYYESWKGCHQDIENTSKSIASLTETLELVSRVVGNRKGQGEPVEQQISSIVVRCLTGIEALSKELEGFEKYPESADIRSKIKSHMRRLYYPFKESTLAKLRDSVQDVRDDLVPALAVLQMEKLSSLEEGTKNVTISLASMHKGRFYQSIDYTYLNSVNSFSYLGHFSNNWTARLQDELRTWLRAPDPIVNQNAASRKCQKDTGAWLLVDSEYVDWKDQPNSFLWLQGFAGCGKTILCSTVINDMTRYTASRTQAALAFYYFDFTNDVKTKTLSCLRSIILQLAEQTADTTSLQALQRTYAMGTPPIQEFSNVLKSILCEHNRVYIVVDALDECTDQEELFDLLNSIRDWELESLSILVTSRDEPDIRECLHPAPEQEIRLRNSAIDNDLTLFIVEALQKDKKLQVWSDIFPEIEEALTDRAHGMFRWVDCQLQTLRGCPSRAEARKALINLPETLDKTYERMLRNIRPSLRDYAVRLLQWLCIADEPVDLDHIMDAFATSIGEEPCFDPDARFVSSDKVLALCPGLIIKSNAWESRASRRYCVQIAHYSVKEYLVSNRLPMAPNPLCSFRVQQPLANLAMAKTCLVYAIFAPHELGNLSLGFSARLETSFMRSAKENWPIFFSNAKSDPQLMELAVSYLTRKKGYTLDGDINAAMNFAIKHRLHDIEIWLVDHHRLSIDPSLALLAKCQAGEIHSLDFVEFWIKQGADVNAHSINERYREFNPQGLKPLHAAAYVCNVALAQLLVQHGASLKAEDNNGSTPLMAAFGGPTVTRNSRVPTIIPLELIELLWFDGGQNCCFERGENCLHRVVRFGCQQRRMDGIVVLTAEFVAWLIDHELDPLHKNAEGETPLHIAAIMNDSTTIKALYAATGRSSEYGGCLLAFLQNVRLGERMLSTAQLLLEIDPDHLGEFCNGSGLLALLLSRAAERAKKINSDKCAFGSGFTALMLKHEEDPARTQLDLYMSFLEFILEYFSSDVSTIMRWLVMELVKRKGPKFLGIEIWSAAVIVLSQFWVEEIRSCWGEIPKNTFRQIQELFERRNILGIGIKELYRLLLWTALDGGPLAKLLISQEPSYAALGLSDETQRLRRLYDIYPCQLLIISLMVHREIHPDTNNKNNDAALLNTITLKAPNKIARLLMERFLLKRAGDINHQTQEGLTLLAGCVAFLPSSEIEETELLRSCLDAGCDANIQDDAGRTPLMIAAYRGSYNLVNVLLRAGCNANLQDREGGTPVTDIVVDDSNSYYDKQNLWKERYSPVGGHTALMYAVIVKQPYTIELLLKHGCDTKLKNNQGRTALDLARQFDEIEIVEILE